MKKGKNIAISEEYSERLTLLRFPLIVGVVFIHAYGATVLYSDKAIGSTGLGGYVVFIQNMISQGLGRVAVPMFFLLSGYFFFLNFNFSNKSYICKLSSRYKTLLIPFLFWNIATLFALWLVQLFPDTHRYFPDKNLIISTYGIHEYLSAILGINRFPIAYQFWFIRDLMVVILLVPLLSFLLRKIPLLSLGVAGLSWFFSVWSVEVPSIAALFFFYLGAYISFYGKDIFLIDKFGFAALLVYLTILLIDTSSIHSPYHRYLHKIGLLLGIASAFYLTSYIASWNRIKSLLIYASTSSFFVFAMHEPFLTVVKKISYIVFNPTSVGMILTLYLAIPVFVVGSCLLLYYLCQLFLPKLLGIITGGR